MTKIFKFQKSEKKFRTSLNIKNIDNLLNWSDLVLTGEGNLRFETAFKGVPAIFFNNIGNSKKIYLINNFLKLKLHYFLNIKN